MKKIVIFILLLLSLTLQSLQLITAEGEYDGLDDYKYTSGSFNNELSDITEFNSTPTITILTPGLSSDASTWGMDINTCSVEDYSIISYLHRRGADVYIANQIISSSENASKEIFDASTLGSIRISQLFSGEIVTVENLSTTSKSFYNKSIVIVFNPYMENEGHDIYGISSKNGLAYYELESVVNAIIYKYMEDNSTNSCPKINMIGHSRGGLLNMLYALQHPNVVDTLVSVGTPYNGSELGAIDGSLQAIKFFTNSDDNATEVELSDTSSNDNLDCITDALNENLYKYIRNLWNNYQNTNNTKLIAIGSSMTFNLIKNLFNYCTSTMFTGTSIVELIGRNILSKFNELLSTNYRYLHSSGELIDRYNLAAEDYRENSFINSIDYNLDFYQSCVSIINIFRSIFGCEYNQYLDCIVCCEKPCTCSEEESLVIDVFNNLISYIAKHSVFDQTIENENGNGDFILLDDFYVDLSSQCADDYTNVIQYEKVFDTNNSDISRLSYDDLPYIGHNMEQKDQDIIKCILTNITLGPNDNGFIISENNEIIGFNYSKAIDENGTMRFTSSILSYDTTYILSNKLFEKDYNLAQVSKENNLYTFESTSHISEIIFENLNIFVEEYAFAFLQDQVRFEIINSNLYNKKLRYFVEQNSLFSQKYDSTDKCYYGEKTLVKFGCGEHIVSFPIISNCDVIGKGAFFCQPILDVRLTCSVKEIKDYAFYGCTNLRKIDYEETVENKLTTIGKFVIDNTPLYNNSEIVVVLDYIFKYDNSEIFQTSKYNNLIGIAPGAFKNNKKHLTIVFDTDDLQILSNAFNGNFISNVIIIEEPNYYDDSFVNILKLNGDYTFNVYSPYENLEFLGIEAKTFFELDIKYLDGTAIDNCVVYFDMTKPCYVSFSENNYNINSKNCIGFNIENSREIIDNLYNEYDFFELFDNEIFVYLSCEEHNLNELYNLQIIVEDSNYHLVLCDDCNYIQYDKHIMNSIDTDSLSHVNQCIYCTYYEEEEHILHDEYDKYVDCIKHKKVCDFCNYTEYCQNNIYMSITGTQHTITCTECFDCNVYEDHLYISLDWQNMCINVCLFCDFHICNGIVGSSDYYGHSVLCQYCGIETTTSHYFTDESPFINGDNDILFGYHYKTCNICFCEVHQQHFYELQEDNHTYKCIDCNAEYVYQHEQTNDFTITSNQHITYCTFCDVYYRTNHNFIYYENGLVREQGHQKNCSDCGYVIDEVHIFEKIEYNSDFHQDICRTCFYAGHIEEHNLNSNCIRSDVNEHYVYCTDCSFTKSTSLYYESLHEYEHKIICLMCSRYSVESHSHNCEIIDDELHSYRCYYCEVDYEMPHYVNDQYIIYYYDEVHYKIICLYCGYVDYEVHKLENCPCESC